MSQVFTQVDLDHVRHRVFFACRCVVIEYFTIVSTNLHLMLDFIENKLRRQARGRISDCVANSITCDAYVKFNYPALC